MSPPPGQKGDLAAEIQATSATEVERLIGEGSFADLDFEAVETATRQMALGMRGHLTRQRIALRPRPCRTPES